MAFFFLVVYLVTLYIRPGEIVTAWRGLPITLYVGVVSIAVAGFFAALRRRRLLASPQDLYAYALAGSAVLSTVVNGWAGGILLVLERLGPSIAAFFLIRVAVDSQVHMGRLRAVVVLLTVFLAGNGLLQHYTGAGLGDVEALSVRTFDESGSQIEGMTERRIRGTGIFNDPNDLAFALVLAVPLAIAVTGSSARVASRVAGALFVALMVTAIVLTKSRGGMVGLLAGVTAFLWFQKRRKVAAACVILAGIGFVTAASGRMGTFSASEASAQGRVEAWSAGLTMVKSNPVFGVGFGAYTDHHQLVAHNSFIHVAAELGLVGAFCFLGLVISFVRTLGSTLRAGHGQASAWLAAGLGSLICVAFLSRQYSVLLFILFGLAGSMHELGAESAKPTSPIVVAFGVVLGLITIYGVVLLLGAW